MNYYIASGLENAKRVGVAAHALSQHTRTYDWTTHGDIRSEGPMRMQQVCQSELQAVIDAELVVFLFPGGKGTHSELGIALATAENKRIILWSETGNEFRAGNGEAHPSVCAFYFHPGVERWICPFETLLERLRAI